jgi:hypothetical protein
MARRTTPLNADLPAVLTRQELLATGHGKNRESRTDLVKVGYGLYRRTGAGPVLPLGSDSTPGLDTSEGTAQHVWPLDHLAALLRRHPTAVLSHETAAVLHGIPLPTSRWRQLVQREDWAGVAEGLPPIHLSLPKGSLRIRRAGVVDHRRKLEAQHVTELHGLRVTTLERTWLDLCAIGYPWLLDELVAAGDHLVKHPWHPHGRLPPLSTVAEIRRALAEVGQFKGKRLANQALELVRVGADAPSETKMRLALLDAGLPEPELQCPIDPEDEDSPESDLGYRDCLLAMQYEGAGHRTAEQQTRDVRRDRYAADRGWATLKANVEDLRDGFRSFIRAVRARREAFGC